MNIGQKIKMYRKRAGLTQRELAKKAGYKDFSSIGKLERGLVDIPQSKIYDIAKALNISPFDLMEIPTEKPNPLILKLNDMLYDMSDEDIKKVIAIVRVMKGDP